MPESVLTIALILMALGAVGSVVSLILRSYALIIGSVAAALVGCVIGAASVVMFAGAGSDVGTGFAVAAGAFAAVVIIAAWAWRLYRD